LEVLHKTAGKELHHNSKYHF